MISAVGTALAEPNYRSRDTSETPVDLPVLASHNAWPSGAANAPGRIGCSAKSCGVAASAIPSMSDAVREQVQDHPCYSEDAHKYFARMHVAVAPACNIQCHYCNRKYDCANESRPGVVSEVLSPEESVRKVLAVGAAIPQLSVVGVAGPGDPLANPKRTFATFDLLRKHAPDLKLCVSTNGLTLPTWVDVLAGHNVAHVTITINCIDPDVGAAIYPWVLWNRKRVGGRDAAAILIEQQQKGLEMCVARGILVKVNSVLIPGINDEHLREVSRVVKAKGAFLHNVMPLISAPEHGTHFGKIGLRGPTAEELQALQDACAGDMRMMRHCRQCRADAVGLLGEDRSAEFTLDKIDLASIDLEAAAKRRAEVRSAIAIEREAKRVANNAASTPETAPAHIRAQIVSLDALRRSPKEATLPPVRIAVASRGSRLVDEHFGHATRFLVYEVSAEGAVRYLDQRTTDVYCGGSDACGDAESALARSLRALEGCIAVLCSKIGYEPWRALEAAGITPNGEHALEPIEEAVRAVYAELRDAGKLVPLTPSLRQLA